MRFGILAIAVIIGVTVQATLRMLFSLPGAIVPDFIFCLVISYGLLYGPDHGLIFGALAGFLMDIVSGGLIGVGALTKMLAGFFAGLMEKTIFKDNLLVPTLTVLAGTVIFGVLEIILRLAFNTNLHFGLTLLTLVLPLSLYNALVTPAVHFFLLKMDRYVLERKDDIP